MAASNLLLLIITFLLLHCFYLSCSARHLTALVSDQPQIPMTYHNGALLTGPISLNLIWYGNFTPSQRAIVTDFLSSLSSKSSTTTTNHQPSVATWWSTTRKYFAQTKTRFPTLTVGDHILDPSYSLGKSLSSSQLAALASKGRRSYAVNIVLTSADVAVEGFCMSRCGTHGSSSSSSRTKSGRFAYIWVGNSAEQCPGQCAWPFHQPAYGPQTDALVAPNGDVGVDGMVVTLAKMLVGTVTNPFGSGFFQGPKEAPLEAGSACSGVYGKGAYPGYAGELLVDPTTGASYNANGVHGRRYLLPAVFDPLTQACSMLV